MLAVAAATLLWAHPGLAQLLEDPTLPAPRQDNNFGEWGETPPGDAGVQAVLNLDFEAADAFYEERRMADPASPEGEFGLGLSAWWKLVSGVPGASPEEVETHLEAATKLSKTYAEEAGRRPEALYFSGRANSLLAAFYLIENKKVPAARAGQRAQSYLSLCLKEDPTFHDAYLGLGLYHYYAAALPKFFKVFGWLVGVRGDHDLGLKELRLAVAKGERTSGEARYFLSNVLSNFEGRPDESLPYLRLLVQKYPGNHVFFLEYTSCIESLGYYPEAELVMRATLGAGGRYEGVRAVRLMLGRNLYRQARYDEGAEILEREVQGGRVDRSDPALPWFYYFAGRCRDLSGDWEAASKHYAAAAAFKTGGNVPGLAKSRLEDRESEGIRRLRHIRGLTRQNDHRLEAAEAWTAIRADVEAGRVTADVSIDVIRFRQGLCFEEAGRFAEAREAYRAVQWSDDIAVRAYLGVARCYWREGNGERARAVLDSLKAATRFPGRGAAGHIARVLAEKSTCSASPASVGDSASGARFVYRDPEAWIVSVQYETESGEACAPMIFREGVWEYVFPGASVPKRYYYRVDSSRREPDPLTDWERGDRGTIWSVTELSPNGRTQWSERNGR